MSEGWLRRLDRLPEGAGALVLGLLAGALLLLLFDPRVTLGGDNALYIALATALREQGQYRDLVAPGAPLETSVPWGFPALLAAQMQVVGDSYAALARVAGLWLLGGVLLAAAWLRRQLAPLPHGGALALLAGLLVAMDEQLLRYGSEVLTEAPYLVTSMGALWLLARAQDREDRGAPPSALATLLPALLAALGYLLRPVGLAMVLALPGWLLWRRRWRALLGAGLVELALLGSWHLWAATRGDLEQNLYLRWFVKRSKWQEDDATVGPLDLLRRVAVNAWAYATDVLPEVLLGGGLPGQALVGLLLALGVGVGLLASARRRLSPGHLYLPLYLLALLLWLPESVNNRYLVVTLPLLLAFLFEGVTWAGQRLPAPSRAWVPLVLTLLIGGNLVDRLARVVPDLFEARAGVARGEPMAGMGQGERDFHALCLWVAAHAAPDDIVASRKARLAWYFSGRSAVDLPAGDEPEALMAFLDREEVDLLIVDSLTTRDRPTRQRLRPLLRAYPERFELLHRAEGGDFVMRVLPATGEGGSGGG